MTGEAALHQQFEAYLRKQGIPWSHDRMDKRTSANDSDPDFRCYRNGQVAFVEFKVGRNKLSPAQVDRIEELRQAGCETCVAYDLQTAVSHVEAQLLANELQRATTEPEQAYPGNGKESVPTTTGPCLGYPGGSFQPLPKLYLIQSRHMGPLVVTSDATFIRLAKPADMNLPAWTEALS